MQLQLNDTQKEMNISHYLKHTIKKVIEIQFPSNDSIHFCWAENSKLRVADGKEVVHDTHH